MRSLSHIPTHLPERMEVKADTARLLVLLDRISALPEAGFASMEAYCERVEAMHGVRRPEAFTERGVRPTEATGRLDARSGRASYERAR